MRSKVLLVVMVAVTMVFAYPDLGRPHVTTSDGAAHVAGQLVIQLSQSQRELVNVTSTDGVMLFGIPALDQLSRKWKVDDVTKLMGNPRPNEIDKRLGCDLQYVIQFSQDQDITPVAADYRALSQVEVVCPNGVLKLDETPNDPSFNQQYHHVNLGAVMAWNVAHGDSTVVNVPIDDGVDYGHPDLEANFLINPLEDINGNGKFDPSPPPGGDLDGIDNDGNGYTDDVIGYDFLRNDPDPIEEGTDTHGTHCYGITNAVTNNAIGVSGATWNSRSLAVRAGGGGTVTLSAAIASIYYSIMRYAFCISMSFGGSAYPPLATACQDAWDNGLVLFGSAGNDGARMQRWPACNPGVENVAASTMADKKASWSNWGPWVDVTAPGEGIYSTLSRVAGSYGPMDGTSMSCPLAAGVACWIKSYNPSLDNQQVIDQLHVACDTMPDSLWSISELGAGRVSMANVILPLYYSDLKMESWRFNDAAGNGNGRPDPGETVSLIVTYKNSPGWRDASDVWATVTCSGTGVQIVKDTARFPNIPGGSSGNCSADSFIITIPSSVPPQMMTFNLTAHATPDVAYPSSSFETQCGEPRVLIVDDDNGSDYEKYYTAACDSNGVLYHTYSVQTSGSPSADTLSRYPVVFWFTGNDSTTTLTPADITSLTAYLNGGGRLFIAGQNIAQDLAGDDFLSDYLHASLADDSTGKTFVLGLTGDPITQHRTNPAVGDTMVLGGAGGANNAKSCDGIRPVGGAVGCATYKDYADTTVQAAIHYSGTYRLVYFACPFEAIDHSVSRYLQKWTMVARILRFFGEGVPGVEQELPLPDIRPYALQVSPNPFRGSATVRFLAPTGGVMELRTYSSDGRLVASQSQAARMGQLLNFRLDGTGLANGIYMVQVVTPVGIYARKTAVLK
jgi:hypothetical protein